MKQFLAILLTVTFTTMPVYAQPPEVDDPLAGLDEPPSEETVDVDCAPFLDMALPEPTLIEMEHEGVPGIWYRIDSANCLFAYMSYYPQILEVLQKRVAKTELDRDAADEQLKLSVAENLQLDLQVRNLTLEKVKLEDKLGAWWRHPALWTAVGAVLVGTGAVVIKLKVGD